MKKIQTCWFTDVLLHSPVNDDERLYSFGQEEIETKAFGSVSIVEDAGIAHSLKIEKEKKSEINETHFGGYHFSLFSCVSHDRE